MRIVRNLIAAIIALALLGGVGVVVVQRVLSEQQQQEDAADAPQQQETELAAPVEVAPVQTGTIEATRLFSGTLEPNARVTIAPKVAGRVVRLPYDLADEITRGDVVAELDDAEFQQAVFQAEAELAVAQAELAQAENAAEISKRELGRIQTLHERGVASDSQLDTATAQHLGSTAAVKVARARITRAEALLQAATIRLGYATVRAEWEGAGDTRVVAMRMVEEGDTVGANTPLLSIVTLDPIDAVIFATERDYAQLEPGQPVTVITDAYPQKSWTGAVARVSPVFQEGSRQARVEISVPNAEGLLKPGMFARIQTVLGRVDNATIVPVQAISLRSGQPVVFLLDADGERVRMVPVIPGVRDGARVQVTPAGGAPGPISGRVVVLGQQLLADNSAVVLPAEPSPPAAGEREGTP